jgi:hypothetical protein
MKTIEEIKENLEKLSPFIKKEYKAEIVGIFGSYARGEQTENSDVDILVKFGEGIGLRSFGFELYLKNIFKINVHVVSAGGLRIRLKDNVFKDIHYV